MSENDAYVMSGNRYRGSRYANFADQGGYDASGNVTGAASNTGTGGGNAQPSQPYYASQVGSGITPAQEAVIRKDPNTAGGIQNMVIGAAVPAATTAVGAGVGAGLASGLTTSGSLNLGAQGALGRASAGLLGNTSSSATNAALAGMGGRLGPATPTAVGKAATGANLGGAVGSGFGTAVATLLTGGGIKNAATSGIGAGVGYALGNAVLPGVGGLIGSFIGSTALGKIFGGSTPRQTISASFKVGDDGQYVRDQLGARNADKKQASKYADSISGTLNAFSKAIGLKYKKSFYSETNIGKKDAKTTLNGKEGKAVVSKGKADVNALALKILKDPNNYTLGGDTDVNDYFQKAIAGAKSIEGLGKDLDGYLGSRANAPSRSLIAMENQGNSKYNFAG